MLSRFAFRSAAAKRSVTLHKNKQQLRHCGLLAAVDNIWTATAGPSTSPLLSNPDVLHTATSRLQHRGPDGRQIVFGSMERDNAGRFALGHQRLAIVDPNSTAANMPFQLDFPSVNTKVHLVANGEIYNHDHMYVHWLEREHAWKEPRLSHSDCEVLAHTMACVGPEEAVKHWDGMFAVTAIIQDTQTGKSRLFAARDPVGIKPLYYAQTVDGKAFVLASELKALVDFVDPSTVKAIPPGHYWTPETGLVRYHEPEWNFGDSIAFRPWEQQQQPSKEEVHEAFRAAVSKRMMADVEYGFFLSGGVDSCIVGHQLLPLYRDTFDGGEVRPIPTFTVGMADSPDLMAALAMVDALNADSHVIDHRPRIFTANEVFDLIPKIIYHMETYEAELIRSAIPNWLLAERAGADVKMVLTGEGADELFAGYLYFMDAETPDQVQTELRRLYNKLGDINLHRTDRMTMAHSLEARVPFLDTKFTELVMSLNPALKVVDRDAVAKNAPGREKTYLRQLFEEPNRNGHSIPHAVLWRAKAMQCEGVGEDWVSQLQQRVSALVTDAEMDAAPTTYPLNTPHTKEELYYRRVFEESFPQMAHVVNPWEGGCRAAGASWESAAYTREGLANTDMLTHAFQQKAGVRSFSTFTGPMNNSPQRRSFSTAVHPVFTESIENARKAGFTDFEAMLTSGGDDRSLIQPAIGTNKYHATPVPMGAGSIVRSSCTCNNPTEAGYAASQRLYETEFKDKSQVEIKTNLARIFSSQRERLAKALGLPAGTQVILVPSGSDAEYFPVAIQRALHQEKKKLLNIITQFHEIGAGSSVAAGGNYFSTHAPLVGKLPDPTAPLPGFDSGISEISIRARETDGTVIDSVAESKAIAGQHADSLVISHGVFGGKTGLRDAQMPASSGDFTSMGVVDACQGRFSQAELEGWLANGSVVLFTGSKFYQAPPFCGAVLIPKNLCDKLSTTSAPSNDILTGLSAFVTDLELPECLESWKSGLATEDKSNIGLALRWEAALQGMEALSKVSDQERVQAVDEWANNVKGMVSEEAMLDPWCVERSIVSIRLKNTDGGWRSMSELRDVYRYMSLDLSKMGNSPEEQEILGCCCSLGQPVNVSDSHAILRIALGAESLTNFVQNPDRTLEQDRIVIRKLELVAEDFEALQQLDI